MFCTRLRGRNCPVIQEIREQPCDLERSLCQAPSPPETEIIRGVQQPVDGETHFFLLLFLAFDHPIVNTLHHVFIGVATLLAIYRDLRFRKVTSRRVLSFPSWFMCKRVCEQGSSLRLIKPPRPKSPHGLGVYWQALQKEALTGAAHIYMHAHLRKPRQHTLFYSALLRNEHPTVI